VGWYQSGGGPWDPPVYTPFIWTPENGAQDLNTYVTETLEFDLNGDQIFVPTDLSSNGQYICGWSFNPNPDPWGEYHTFRLQISEEMSVNDLSNVDIKLYPNPTNDIINIQSNSKIKSVQVYNMNGQVMISKTIQNQNAKINVAGYISGTYIVKVETESGIQTHKIIKK